MKRSKVSPGDRALILTLGISSDSKEGSIVDALMIDIAAFKPRRVVMASTDLSRPVADTLAARLQPERIEAEHLSLPSAHDLPGIFGAVRGVIFRLLAEGFRNENIAVNYASGTKVMSSGLTLAAVFGACGSLRYVRSSVRQPAEERLISTSTGPIFAHRDILLAILLGSELRFRAARHLLENIQADFLTEDERQLSADLIALFRAYSERESFNFGRFLELYGQVSFAHRELAKFRLSPEGLAAVKRLDRDVAQGRPSRLLCVELFNSAQRRRHEGEYSDGMTRLYRALELLAQQRLRDDYAINADDVDAHRVPPRYRPDFEALRSPQDGRIRLGLRKSYELLYRLDDELGRSFEEDPQMTARLDERRATMLAHGVAPASKELDAAFDGWVTGFFMKHIEDFAGQCRRLQFPWLAPHGA